MVISYNLTFNKYSSQKSKAISANIVIKVEGEFVTQDMVTKKKCYWQDLVKYVTGWPENRWNVKQIENCWSISNVEIIGWKITWVPKQKFWNIWKIIGAYWTSFPTFQKYVLIFSLGWMGNRYWKGISKGANRRGLLVELSNSKILHVFYVFGWLVGTRCLFYVWCYLWCFSDAQSHFILKHEECHKWSTVNTYCWELNFGTQKPKNSNFENVFKGINSSFFKQRLDLHVCKSRIELQSYAVVMRFILMVYYYWLKFWFLIWPIFQKKSDFSQKLVPHLHGCQ